MERIYSYCIDVFNHYSRKSFFNFLLFILLLFLPGSIICVEKPELVIQNGHIWNVNSVAFSADGKYLASGSLDRTIKLWEVSTGRLVRTLEGHTWDVESVAFSADGKYLASGSGDKTIKLWEVSTGRLVRTLEGHTDRINSVAFSADGKYLASGSWDKTIKLWEVSTGRLVCTLEGHTDRINSVAFSADGKYLASGSEDATMKLWNVAVGKLLVTLLATKEGDYIVYTPDGYYDCSPGGARFVAWRVGMEVYSFDQYEATYKRPDIIRSILAGKPVE
ncbi:MAG: WD40 repeat domain-containing protein [Endomicrobia bacterium]|nr:WD40 repeat domain-containing protein [Endomicrobiia bacterium]